MKFLRPAFIAIAITSFVFQQSAHSARELATGEDKLTAFVEDGNAWCSEQADITLTAPDENAFSGDMIGVQKMLAGLRIILDFECPEAKSIRLTGKVDGTIIHQSIAAESSGWILEVIVSETELTGPGSLLATTSLETRCQIIDGWANRLKKEYPGFSFRIKTASTLYPKMANLFGDKDFVPVFGHPYDAIDYGFRKKIADRIFRKCPQFNRGQTAFYSHLQKPFTLKKGTFSFEEVSRIVKKRRKIRKSIDSMLQEIETLQLTEESWNKLENMLADNKNSATELWPSENDLLKKTLSPFITTLAIHIAREQIWKELPASVASLKEIQDALNLAKHRTGYRPEGPVSSIFLESGTSASQRREEIQTAIVQKEIMGLTQYPKTLDSLNRIFDRRAFLLDKAGVSSSLPAYQVFDKELTALALEIAETALPEFQAELSAVPTSFDGARQILTRTRTLVAVLNKLAPDSQDKYEQASHARADEIYETLLAQARKSIGTFDAKWHDVSHIMTLAQEKTTEFRGTQAESDAAQLIDIAKNRAAELVRNQFGSFKQELEAIPDNWEGLDTLHEIAVTVTEKHQTVLPIFTDYWTATNIRRDTLWDNIAFGALDRIGQTGSSYKDIEIIEQAGEDEAKRFEDHGDSKWAKHLRKAANERANQVLEASLPNFQQDLAKFEPNKTNAEKLFDMADGLQGQLEQYPAYAAYREAALKQSDIMILEICTGALNRAGLTETDGQEHILGTQKSLQLIQFVCELDELGHQVTGFSASEHGAGTHVMKILQADGQFRHIQMHKTEALPNEIMFVGSAMGDANRQDPISVQEWRDYVATLFNSEESPNETVAVTETEAKSDYQNLHECDELAAHPDDPSRWGTGVIDQKLAPGFAIKRCSEAVKQYPGTARFHFQLGRAFWIAKEYEKAVESFTAAYSMDYYPAFYYLGVAYQYGVGGLEEDKKRANEFIEFAEANGFAPSTEETGETTSTGSEQTYTQTESTKEFNPNDFEQSGAMLALYNGDFSPFKGNEYQALAYVGALLEQLSSEQIALLYPYCIGLINASTKTIDKDFAEISGLAKLIIGAVSSDEAMMDSAGSFLGRALLEDTYKEQARIAAHILARDYGCRSDIAIRISQNAQRFISNY